jgi:spore coat polysaccharide biosynthesis protein SpsF
MGSTRLPGKVLRPIGGVPLLEYIVRRLDRLRHAASVVIATTTLSMDDEIELHARRLGVRSYRGSECNVLERYCLCARENRFSQIVRLTADNPFTDIEELDRLVELHFGGANDFSHSFRSLPVGVGAEVFTFDALERSFASAREPHHLEHVDEYMLEHPELFRTATLEVSGPKNRPDVRLTVDTEEDYRRASVIAERACGPYVGTEEAIRLCMQYA